MGEGENGPGEGENGLGEGNMSIVMEGWEGLIGMKKDDVQEIELKESTCRRFDSQFHEHKC